VLCLDLPDLVVSKLAAGRLKDLEFVGALLRLELCSALRIRRRLQQVPLERERERARTRLSAVVEDLR
jgi:hypothetical protein